MRTTPADPLPTESPPRPRRRRAQWSLRLTPLGVLVVFLCNAVFLLLVGWPIWQSRLGLPVPGFQTWQPGTPTHLPLTLTQTATAPPSSPTPTPAPPSPTATLQPARSVSLHQGLILLALDEGKESHLFAYQPLEDQTAASLPLSRLTIGPWEDTHPAVSPDGKQVVFASNRNGYWDIYMLDLLSGTVSRLTDTLAYDGSPSWSPDGLWVVYETYLDDNLEIFIQSVANPEQPPIRLTANTAADHSPVWSPQGRQIAFVSNRSGDSEIWLADLDQADEALFQNLSQNSLASDTHPSWSPDGAQLAWSSQEAGFHNILLMEMLPADRQPKYVGSGDWPVWSPDGRVLMSALYAPSRHFLTAYALDAQGLVFPTMAVPGLVMGLDWSPAVLELPLTEPYAQAVAVTPTPLWLAELTDVEAVPGGRIRLITLDGLQAPYPILQDFANESFQAMRQRLAADIGWDFLSSLENAYVPLTSPLDPGLGADWLYTGRAIAVNTAPLNAGWMLIVREQFGADTYWRVYLRVRFQDGSAGVPLYEQPWDLNARFGGNPAAYEQGGQLLPVIPAGYWYDFTRLASAYGWQRFPALIAWRASFPATRFNEFALTDGLDWQSAMLEIYPPEVLLTPTVITPPTRTPTPTSRFFQSPTPTLTFTPRPTLTPPGPTLTPTATPRPTRTSVPSTTPTDDALQGRSQPAYRTARGASNG